MEMENTIESEISHSFEHSENILPRSADSTNTRNIEKTSDEVAFKVPLETVSSDAKGELFFFLNNWWTNNLQLINFR